MEGGSDEVDILSSRCVPEKRDSVGVKIILPEPLERLAVSRRALVYRRPDAVRHHFHTLLVPLTAPATVFHETGKPGEGKPYSAVAA